MMLKNNQKKQISKFFLIMVLFCSIFAVLSINDENAYAVELNGSSENEGLELNVQDKQENSLIHDGSLKELNLQDSEIMDEKDDINMLNNSKLSSVDSNVKLELSENNNEKLGEIRTLNGGTFADIQNIVKKANAGDIINLNGYFYHDGSLTTWIKVSKQLTFTSDSQAILDGLNSYQILGIYDDAAGTVIKNIKFTNAYGGWGSAIRICVDNCIIEDCTFNNNHHTEGGAVSSIYDIDKSQNTIVRRCQFVGNNGYQNDYKSTGAGALGLYGRGSQVIDCYFESNWVQANEPCFGGALQIGMDNIDSQCKVIGCTFINNKAISSSGQSHGGAGCVRDGVSYSNCIFKNNQANQGGALTMHASGSIIDCKFENNVATSMYGGAISSGFLYDNMVLKIENCNFENNSAPEGGAIQVIGLDITISNANFKNNHATGSGGAVSVQGNNVNIKNSIFNGNYVEVNGGALYIKGEDTIVQYSKFTSNNAIPDINKLDDGLGGAIYIDSPKASIQNNEFNYNTARNGSAIYYEKTGQNLVLSNNTLFKNQAWVYGLPIDVKDIFFQDSEEINVIIFGGNNIADYDNLAVSNAIYNAAGSNQIVIDGQNPLFGATMTGDLYQDGREYNIPILLRVSYEDGTLIYENTTNSSYLGEISIILDDLKPGLYYVTAKHFEDTYYKEIENITTFRVYPKVENQISITTTPTNYNFEDVVKWIINITNNGPNNATEVIIKNLLPQGLIYYMDDSGGLYDCETGILNVSTLNVGEIKTYNLITIVNKTGRLVNSVNISSKEFDTNISNNYDEQDININLSADISVLKTVNNTHPNYNDYVNWTITIKNNGPDTAHNITIQDLIPHTLKLINYTGNYNLKKGKWEINSLEVGECVKFNIITQIKTTGILQNNVYAQAIEFDYDLSNNKDNEEVFVDPSADLSIIKSVNTSEANYHDMITWILTISNKGPDNATNVVIRDILPDGLEYVNSTLNFKNNEIYIGNLTVGEKIIINITCMADITGNHTNYANISGEEYDYNITNNEDNQSLFIFPASDLEIIKKVNQTEPKFGDLVEWTIIVVNNGPDTANNVIVNDILPKSLIYVEDDSEGKYDSKKGIWNITTLEVDEEISLMIITKINGTGVLTNYVNVTANEYDHDLTNNEYGEDVEVPRSADVRIIKLVNNTSPNYADLIKWTVIAYNNGPDEASNVIINEKIPEGLILINVTATEGVFENFTWSIDLLEKDKLQTLELICKVNKTDNITNIVSIKVDEYDSNTTNNDANNTIEVPPAIDIEVNINVNDKNPLFGESIVWNIMIKNNGPNNATEVKLNEILPYSVIFLNYNSTNGKYANGTWNLDFLEVGGVEYLNITTIVNKTGIITNHINATAHEYDWNKLNNQDNTSINVLHVSDLSIEKNTNNPAPNYLDIIHWTIKVTNNGPNKASNVVVTDNLPAGVEFIKSNDDSNYKNGKWNVGELENGESRILDITCRVVSTGLFTNHVIVDGGNYDPNLENNNANNTISVKSASELVISKKTSKSHYVVGDIVKYTIKVVNNGPDTASNVKISEILDKSLILKSFKLSKGKFDKTGLVWTIKSLKNGEMAILSITVIANGSGIVKNVVKVISDSYDYNVSNNKASAFINVSKAVKNTSNIFKKHNIPAKPSLIKTANPIWSLLTVVMFCAILFTDNIIKKR